MDRRPWQFGRVGIRHGANPERLCSFGQCVKKATCRAAWKYGFTQDSCEACVAAWIAFHKQHGTLGDRNKTPTVRRIDLTGADPNAEYWEKEYKRRETAARKRLRSHAMRD